MPTLTKPRRVTQYCSVLRASHGDCSNSGPSSRNSNITCHFKQDRASTIDAKGFTESEALEYVRTTGSPTGDHDFVIVEDICCGERRLRAIQFSHLLSRKWTMFGGNFCYTSDSRWFKHPVKIHDRIE